jgi:hypothetical protein
MTRLKLVQPAAAGERFAPTAWDSQIGKRIPFSVGERRTRCTLVAAQVAEDGLSVELTIDVDEPAAIADPGLYHVLPGGMSIAFSPIPAEPLRTDRADWRPDA